MKKCLIFLDSEQIQNSIELLEVARQMYPDEHWESYGVAINYSPLEAHGFFDFIIQVNAQNIKQYNVKEITNAISDIHKQYNFDVILIPATWCGRILAPRLAVRLQTGLTADVTEIRHKENNIEMVRPVFSNRLMAGIVNKSNGPVMMSVRQNVFKYTQNKNKQTQLVEFDYLSYEKAGIRQVRVYEKPQSYDIRESSILVSGGGGVGKDFYRLEALAEVLKGHVAASRRIVDKGIAPRSIQVGQSGKTVSPKLYIALGIYGAIQHVEGLKNVDCIISVNTNINAPICSLSDIVVEGDALLFVDLLTERILESMRYQNEGKNN
ncbi:electron transfer flavoprotein subunit alpha/FixB family protein [Ruminiclostridium cellobioparum]|uniref:Electron transfer flavoprotein, alpha subunit n=1 Tax=Ruminiclostridium cellobioparum subsp. termitidis CT1112 TaxID=1195236 RepID=S0FKB5_RUMCE|nr:electron transfer flavoprotein subunit alpha/FixB family protein [Ruminiclostridium cellobioparum]EMS72655.1 Electron transfer flavoprotein, alpha subunit [Ruminiclostridium cellobioparum subsp. termitidis CT1112]